MIGSKETLKTLQEAFPFTRIRKLVFLSFIHSMFHKLSFTKVSMSPLVHRIEKLAG